MSKLISLTITLTILTVSGYCQEPKKDAELLKTKIDMFSSNTGTITKFIDTQLPNLKTSFGGAETKIRKIISGTNAAFFYQIEKQGKYNNSKASIEYSDLLEILKALKALKPEVEKDIALNPDYLENKFVTVDGFQVGYYISKGKAVWFIKLERFGSDNTLFIDNSDTLETAFVDAKNKVDEFKNK